MSEWEPLSNSLRYVSGSSRRSSSTGGAIAGSSPPRSGVAGWTGFAPIFFVAVNPSSGEFPSKADLFYYSELVAAGLGAAHLTDVIKARATEGKAKAIIQDPAQMARHRSYLVEEIRIVRPRLIVAVGNQARRILGEWLDGDPRLDHIPHYSPRYPKLDTPEKFREALARVAKRYRVRA